MQERRIVTALTVPDRRSRWGLVAVVAAFVVLLDQLTKRVALDRLAGRRPVELLGSLQLRLVYNRGSAFSIGSRYAPLIALAAAAFVVVLLGSHRRLPGVLAAVALALVVGGAVGNLLDRAFRDGDGLLGGAVIDFVDLQWWPVFNLADSCIVVGAAGLALTLGREGT